MKIQYFFRGYSEFVVKVNSCPNFLQSLKGNIPIRNVVLQDGSTVKFICFFDSVKKVKKIIGESCAEIVSEKKHGIPNALLKYRKRAGLLIGGAAVLIYIMISQLFVWEIRVEGNENLSDEEILDTLKDIGFKEGVLKKTVNTDSLVNNFLIAEKRISWIAVNFDGTVAHVEVREGINPRVNEKRQNVNLIASHDGIIMRSDVVEGGTLVKKGDVVYKNQLLVNAFIDRNDKSTLRGAKGRVWAYTERSICVIVPLTYYEKEYTQGAERSISVRVLGKKVDLLHHKPSFYKYDTACKSLNNINNGKYILPFTVEIKTATEYKSVVKERSEQQALLLAQDMSDAKIKEISPTFTIATKQSKYHIQDGVLEFTCYYSGVEDIAKELEFELS